MFRRAAGEEHLRPLRKVSRAQREHRIFKGTTMLLLAAMAAAIQRARAAKRTARRLDSLLAQAPSQEALQLLLAELRDCRSRSLLTTH